MEKAEHLKQSDRKGEKEEQNNSNYFKPDNDNNNLETDEAYQNWYKIMSEINNNDVICKCPNDKIYFFNNYKCPLCNVKICNYCSSDFSENDTSCCVRRRLKDNHEYGLKIMDNKKRNEMQDSYHEKAMFYFLIPGLSLLFFIGSISVCLFYKIRTKNHNEETYLDFLIQKRMFFGYFFTAINVLIAFILVIPLFIFNFYLNLISFLLIVFLDRHDKCPYMYFIGFIENDWSSFFRRYL